MTRAELLEVLGDAPRVVVVGGPRTGKSMLAHALGREVKATDELVGVLEWSEVSAEVATWITAEGSWVIEGVATARALRKWLAANPGAALDATIVLMGKPFAELTKGQAAMGKGVATVWDGIAADVLARGARVINAASPKPVRQGSESPSAPAPHEGAAPS